jgi:hypothetical protein
MTRIHSLSWLGVALAAVGAGGWLLSAPTPTPGVVLAARAPGPAMTAEMPATSHLGGLPSTAMAMPERLMAGEANADLQQRIMARLVDGRPMFHHALALEEARQQQVLFATGVSLQAASQSPLANERRLQDGRKWISYDMRVLSARAEGDTFLLPLPGAASTQAEVELVEVLRGQFRWSGRLLGEPGGRFYITQSMGDQYAVGAIQTAEGEFLLEAKAGTGWITHSHNEFVLPPDGNDTVHEGAETGKR